MKCSQKVGFIYILVFILIVPTKGKGFSFSKRNDPFREQDMELSEISANILDSFPNPDIKPHRIVKKQMAVTDYVAVNKNDVKICDCFDSCSLDYKGNRELLKAANEDVSLNLNKRERSQRARSVASDTIFGKIKELAFDKRNILRKRFKRSKAFFEKKAEGKENLEEKSHVNEKHSKKEKNEFENQENLKNLIGQPCKRYVRLPDKSDCHSYYECVADKDGRMKLQHKRCPQDELFSANYLECLKKSYLKAVHRHKRLLDVELSKKVDVPDSIPDGDSEPANEWLDATQGSGQKIPSEFKPKQKPKLRIYHLRCKRKLVDSRRIKRNVISLEHDSEATRKSLQFKKDKIKRENTSRLRPRSFLIRINKKEGKNNKEQKVTENDESESEEDDEETEEEDDDETDGEDDEEDEGEEDEDESDKKSESSKSGGGLKEFFKTAKAAVTNRARFNEGPSTMTSDSGGKSGSSSMKSSKTETGPAAANNSKKVLIDANIKVDSSLGSALKSILSKRKEKSAKNPKDEKERYVNNKDQMDLESINIYDNLIKSNPRVKRYFLSTLRT